MRNWKTTLAGIVAALALVTKFTSGEPVKMDDVLQVAAVVGVGVAAKDHNVSGTGK